MEYKGAEGEWEGARGQSDTGMTMGVGAEKGGGYMGRGRMKGGAGVYSEMPSQQGRHAQA